jgi:hypothetical protein
VFDTRNIFTPCYDVIKRFLFKPWVPRSVLAAAAAPFILAFCFSEYYFHFIFCCEHANARLN